MASMPTPPRAGRPRAVCYRCIKPRVSCICASVEPVANRTGIIILQHPRERFHPLGTARIARLGLTDVRIAACAPWDPAAPRPPLPGGTALLYPAAAARELATLPEAERPRHLVVIDATWFNARKIYAAHGWLRALPHVGLTPEAPSRYRHVRKAPRPDYLATLEAIVGALRILEPRTRGLDGLLQTFAAMVDRQAAYTG